MKFIIGSLFIINWALAQSSITIPVTGLVPDANGNINITVQVKVGTPAPNPYKCGATHANPVPETQLQEGVNEFGCQVVRVTNDGTSSHFYTDRSPLSPRDRFMVINGAGGSTLMVELDSTGHVVWGPQNLTIDLHGPYYLSSYMWSKDEDEVLYIVASGTKLWKLNMISRTWILVYDFGPLLVGPQWPEGGFMKIGYASLNKVILDYNRVNKEGYGIVSITRPNTGSPFTVRADAGTQLDTPSPKPNASFKFAGLGGVTRDGDWILIQENGSPVNPSSGLPIERASTLTFRQPTLAQNYFIGGESLSGQYNFYHNTTGTRHNCRVTGDEVNEFQGFDPATGGPDWITKVRCIDITEPQNFDMFMMVTPFVDIFKWKQTLRQSGAHLSIDPADVEVAISLYQEGSATQARITDPFANEIILARSWDGQYRRVAHHYTKVGPDYWQTPRAVFSASGKWVIFTSSGAQSSSDKKDIWMVRVGQ